MSAPRLLAPTTISGGVPTAGAGTLNTIALWTPDGNTLGNSLLTQAGNVTTNSGTFRTADGSNTEPGYTFTNSSGSGMYRGSSGTILRFASSGTFAFGVSSTGSVLIGGTATTTPASALHVRNNTAGITLDSTLGSGRQYQLNPLRTGTSNAGFEIRDVTAGAAVISIDASQQVGIGTASPLGKLQVGSAATLSNYQASMVGIMLPLGSGNWLELCEDSVNGTTFKIGKDASTGVTICGNSKDLGFSAGGYQSFVNSCQMVLKTSGNLGIGTTSPGAILHTLGTGTTTGIFATSSANAWVELRRSTSTTLGYIGTGSGLVTGGAAADLAFRCESGNLLFSTVAAERARIDSAGNVGIGVIPSAWASSVRAEEMRTHARWNYNSGSDSVAYWTVNAFLNSAGNAIYKATAAASQYTQIGGAHVWERAVSGTAGNTVTWLESARIDATGNFGIATSTMVAPGLTVTDPTNVNNIARANLRNNNSDVGNRIATVGYNGNTIQLFTASESTGTANNTLAFFAYNLTSFYTGTTVSNPQERMRIDSTGNVGIGTGAATTTPAATGSLVIGQNNVSQQWAARIYGGNDANRAPVLSLFRAGNTEGIIAEIKNGAVGALALGITGGVANFNDATLSAACQVQITSTLMDISGASYGLKLPATPGNPDTQTLDCYQETTLSSGFTTSGITSTGTFTVTARATRIGRSIALTVKITPSGGASLTFASGWYVTLTGIPQMPDIAAFAAISNDATGARGSIFCDAAATPTIYGGTAGAYALGTNISLLVSGIVT